jgi:hypothetical protein
MRAESQRLEREFEASRELWERNHRLYLREKAFRDQLGFGQVVVAEGADRGGANIFERAQGVWAVPKVDHKQSKQKPFERSDLPRLVQQGFVSFHHALVQVAKASVHLIKLIRNDGRKSQGRLSVVSQPGEDGESAAGASLPPATPGERS